MSTEKQGQQFQVIEPLSSKPEFDAVVHIGAPKTGSSALQLFLMKNASLLEKHGFYYPTHGVDANGISAGHTELGIHFIKKDLAGARLVFQRYIEQARAKKLRLLLSSESFYPFADDFKSIIGGDKVRVIGLFRDPLDAIASSYNQLVKRHFYADTLGDFCRLILKKNTSEYSGEYLLRWQETFGSGNVDVYRYDNMGVHTKNDPNKIENFFLAVLGIPKDKHLEFSFAGKLINRSYTDCALELKRLLNRILDQSNDEMNGKIDVCLQSYSDTHAAKKMKFEEVVGLETLALLRTKYDADINALNTQLHFTDTSGQTKGPEAIQSISSEVVKADSLELVAGKAFHLAPEVLIYIRNCLCNKLTPGKAEPNIVKLVNLFGLQGCTSEVGGECEFLDKEQLQILGDSNATRFDVLYQVAVLLERYRAYSAAHEVISELLKLRPNGPVLLAASSRLQHHLKSHQGE